MEMDDCILGSNKNDTKKIWDQIATLFDLDPYGPIDMFLGIKHVVRDVGVDAVGRKLKELRMSQNDLAAELQTVVSELVGLSGLLKPATKMGLDAIKDKYYEVVKELEPYWLILDDHLAAVKSRASAALTTYRADYQTAYWKPRKVQEQWVSGGWPKGLAKLYSDKVAQFFLQGWNFCG